MKLKVEYSQEEVAQWVVDNLAKHGVQAASGADIWVKWDTDGRLVSMEVAVEPLPVVAAPTPALPAQALAEAAQSVPVKKTTKRAADMTPEELEQKRARWREQARKKNARNKVTPATEAPALVETPAEPEPVEVTFALPTVEKCAPDQHNYIKHGGKHPVTGQLISFKLCRNCGDRVELPSKDNDLISEVVAPAVEPFPGSYPDFAKNEAALAAQRIAKERFTAVTAAAR